MERETHKDAVLSKVIEHVQNQEWHKYNGPKAYLQIKDELSVIGSVLLKGSRIVVPEALRSKILKLGHKGHLGIVGTKQNLRTRVYWPGMAKDIEKFVKTCHECQITDETKIVADVSPTKLPDAPWKCLGIDYLGPLPSGESVLVVVDYFSRYYEVAYTKKTTTKATIDKLEEIFFRLGYPVSMRADNGPQFRTEMHEYCETKGIHLFNVIPRWPQANGEV